MTTARPLFWSKPSVALAVAGSAIVASALAGRLDEIARTKQIDFDSLSPLAVAVFLVFIYGFGAIASIVVRLVDGRSPFFASLNFSVAVITGWILAAVAQMLGLF
jgi:hypothetical protein